jgi:mRNA-degrading endonuclease RelE of RelBE toxin-antitoxin system
MIFGMNNIVYYSPEFKKSLKPLVKKYISLKDTISQLEEDLKANPYMGESYGDGIYKIRVADKSKGKGKSGGFRVMYYMIKESADGVEIVLVTIFDKSERSTYTKKSAMVLRDIAVKSMSLIIGKK